MRIVIHANLSLPNQTESAGWLQQGFRAKGIDAEITGDKTSSADIHVVQGPWYCLKEWTGQPNVLFLDRCFYGHPRWDISLGWLNADGSRDFRHKGKAKPKGEPPELKPLKPYRGSCVVFADYGQDPDINAARKLHPRVYYRPHPRDTERKVNAIPLRGDLDGVWGLCDTAIGHSSTVLVEAVLNGLHVTSTDPRHVIQGHADRERWVTELTWCQWNFEELKRGDFVEHLCQPL